MGLIDERDEGTMSSPAAEVQMVNEVARERVRTTANEVREYVVLGHQLEVYLRDDQWRVVVDGVESLARFAAAYAAWAAGAADAYRQGRTPGTPRLHD